MSLFLLLQNPTLQWVTMFSQNSSSFFHFLVTWNQGSHHHGISHFFNQTYLVVHQNKNKSNNEQTTNVALLFFAFLFHCPFGALLRIAFASFWWIVLHFHLDNKLIQAFWIVNLSSQSWSSFQRKSLHIIYLSFFLPSVMRNIKKEGTALY